MELHAFHIMHKMWMAQKLVEVLKLRGCRFMEKEEEVDE